MAQITHVGAVRARLLAEIRGLHEFRIGPIGQRVELEAVWSDPTTRTAWIDCNTGTWRLPSKLYRWAELIEDRARETLGHDDIFPCRAVFDQGAGGEIIVEIFPDGYKSPFYTK